MTKFPSSEQLEEIRTKLANLIGEFQVLNGYVEHFDEEIKQHRREETRIEENRRDLHKKEHDLNEQEQAIIQEKLTLVEQSAEVERKRDTAEQLKSIIGRERQQFLVDQSTWEEKKTNEQKEITDRKEELAGLEERETKLKEDQAKVEEAKILIEREKRIDRERKIVLDAQEEKVKVGLAKIAHLFPEE